MTGNVLAPDAVAPLPGSAATAVAFRWRGQLHVTVIVKATFAFAPDADMRRIEPQPVIFAEVHHGKNPTRSVRFTSEVAPHLGRADVLFTGCAEAPSGAPVQSMGVRVVVYTEQRCALDKRLVAQDPGGFQRMPIVYERAVRDAEGLENPFGVDPSSGPPGVIDPAHPERPAGFGPIARTWPTRKRLLGATPRKALEGAIAEIPEGFDWAYYQAAPLDQRAERLAGDEWILLEGLHPTLPRLQTRLPSARASARIFGLAGMPEGQRLELTADMLHIDGDEQRCTLVWRKSFSVPSEAALPALRIAAGAEVGDEALPWPDPRVSWPSRAALTSEAVGDAAATLMVGGEGAATMMLTPELPGSRAQSALPFQPSSGAASAPGVAAREYAPATPTDTIVLSFDEAPASAPPVALPWDTLAVAPAPSAHTLPFSKPSPDSAPASARTAAPLARVATDTFAISPEDDGYLSGRSALPFSGANKAAPPPVVPPAEPIPEATPIEESPVAAAPEIASVAPPAPPVPAVPPAAPQQRIDPPASPWAPAPPPAEPPAPPVLPAPAPVLKQSLYNRFDRKG